MGGSSWTPTASRRRSRCGREAFMRNTINYFAFVFFILSALSQSTVHSKEKHMSGPAQNGVLTLHRHGATGVMC